VAKRPHRKVALLGVALGIASCPNCRSAGIPPRPGWDK
jgi:hypothetical protein